MTIVFASTNPGKIHECRLLLGKLPVEIRSLLDQGFGDLEIKETGSTFAQNAKLKAETVSRLCGLPTIGEDSGLEVVALGGRPGVYSKRYGQSDQDRIQKLLQELECIEDRRARFVASVYFVDPRGVVHETEGKVEGEIAKIPVGEHGFGYDPIFIPRSGDGRSFAQMSREEKSSYSHRGQAFTTLATELAQSYHLDKSLESNHR